MSATSSPAPAITDLILDVQQLPARYAGTPYNAGDALVWADGNEIWRYALSGSPQLIYTGAPGDYIGPVVASDAGYLFVEEKPQKGLSENPPAHWRLYFLPAQAGTPILIERYTNEQLGNPNIAIDDDYIAWIAPGGTWTDTTLTLHVAAINQLDQPRTLLSYHAEERALGDVALWRDELWYAVEMTDQPGQPAHVEMIDLLNPDVAPTTYGAGVRAVMPAATGQAIAWTGGGDPTESPYSPAPPFVYWRDTGTYEELDLPHPDLWDSGEIQFPTVGNRFVAWWDMRAQQFYVYDLTEHALRRIVACDPNGPRYLQPSINGNLLSWRYSADDRTPTRTQWAYLPE